MIIEIGWRDRHYRRDNGRSPTNQEIADYLLRIIDKIDILDSKLNCLLGKDYKNLPEVGGNSEPLEKRSQNNTCASM